MAEASPIPLIGRIPPSYASLRRLTEPPLFRLPDDFPAPAAMDAVSSPPIGLLAALEGAGRNRMAGLLARVPAWLIPANAEGAESGAEDAEKGFDHPALALPPEGRFALNAPEDRLGL